jgi:hypothetical protein
MAASACYAEYKLLSYVDGWIQVGNIHAPSYFSPDSNKFIVFEIFKQNK